MAAWKAEEAASSRSAATPEELLGALREFAEKQAESVQDAQREQYATLTLNTAVELTAAALGQCRSTGPADAQALALRDAMRVLFPEAVALVSAARQGFMRSVGPRSSRATRAEQAPAAVDDQRLAADHLRLG